MTAITIKRKIISELELTTDKNILQDIFKILQLSKETEEVMKLSEAQKKSIRKGLSDIENGRTISNSKANKEVEKWLSK